MTARILAALALCVALCLARGAAAEPAAAPAEAEPTVRQQVLVLLQMPGAHFRADAPYTGAYADGMGRAARRRLAQALARSHGLGLSADWPMPILGLDCFVMDVPAGRGPDDVAAELARDARVVWAQAVHVFRPSGHDDPLFAAQPAAHEWQLAELHTLATGHDIRVALIDSGVEAGHPDLAGQVELNLNLVDARAPAGEAHGTAVAGIIAARADNHVGIVGVAPGSRLLALRACAQDSAGATRCDTLSLARALHAAIDQGARLVNLSLGGPPDRLVGALVQAALARGIEVVAAADRSAPGGGFPAALRGVVAVSDTVAAGTDGVLVAPGTDVPTTAPGARWSVVSGSSFAAAHVSGLLALMLDAKARRGRAREAASGDLVRQGDGRVDACASLARAGAACACGCGSVAPMAAIVPR